MSVRVSDRLRKFADMLDANEYGCAKKAVVFRGYANEHNPLTFDGSQLGERSDAFDFVSDRPFILVICAPEE